MLVTERNFQSLSCILDSGSNVLVFPTSYLVELDFGMAIHLFTKLRNQLQITNHSDLKFLLSDFKTRHWDSGITLSTPPSH